MVDSLLVLGIPVTLVTMMVADPLSQSPAGAAAVANLGWFVTLVYYLALEGATGASLGKRLFGLRVVSAAASSPGWAQFAVRGALFYAPNMLVAATVAGGLWPDILSPPSSSGFYINWQQTGPPLLTFLMFFATARRSNGWTGLHDVLSGTRVIVRPPEIERRTTDAQQAAAAVVPAGSARRYGPFVAMDAREPRPGAVVRAFDPVLRRQVWIEMAHVSKPPVEGTRRDLSRPARLHWLAGRRSPDENWDAYEAPDGDAWTRVVEAGAWSQVKLQLLDLANELDYSAEDGTQPPLALDRVWIRDNGRIVLLDFAPPDEASGAAADLTSAQLLQAAAARVPRHPSEPAALPLSAHVFLERWSAPVPSEPTRDGRVEGPSLPTIADARAALLSMAAAPSQVQWWRRALPGALAGVPVALMLLVSIAIIPALARFASSDTSEMMNLLGVLRSTTLPADNPMRRPDVREAAEVAIAGRYGATIRDDSFWEAGVVRGLAPDYRPLAEDILARHPDVTPERLAEAEVLLAASRKEFDARPQAADGEPGQPARRQQSVVELSGVIISTITAAALALVLVCLIVSSLVAPGGIVSRQLGLATVTRTGKEITRARSLVRALVAGVPGIVWLMYLAISPKVQGFVPTPPNPITATLVTVGVLAVGLAWTIARRTRGPLDLLTGTWVVPR
jgi:uncharacterized RDD family membrane protein YckC